MRRILGIGLVLAAIAGIALLTLTGPDNTTPANPAAHDEQTPSRTPAREPAPTASGPTSTPSEQPKENPAENPQEPAPGDIPQDRHPDATGTPSAFAPRDEVSDADLQRALERQHSGRQPAPPHDREAIGVAWQYLRQDIAESMTWTKPRRRAAIAILAGPNADPTNPVAVTVTITWAARDRANEQVLEQTSINLTRAAATGRWTLHH